MSALLLEIGFDQGETWKTDVGATNGSGRATSTVEVVDGGRNGTRALRLAGADTTVRWLSATSDELSVSPGQAVHLSGWLRAADVARTGNQFENAYLGVRFTDRRGRTVGKKAQVAGSVRGDADWTAVSGTFLVPDDARNVQVLTFLSMSGTMWVDDVRVEIVDAPVWRTVEQGPFTYHFVDSAPVDAASRAFNEERLAWTAGKLGVTWSGGSIDYWRYPDRETKAAMTGYAGNAHYDGAGGIHTLWPVDSHEMVHLLAEQIGDPGSALLGEGLAVALSESWQGQPVHDWVRSYRAPLPGVATVLDDWHGVSDVVAYGIAGSFVTWLIDTRGMDQFEKAYGGAGPTRVRLETVYGVPFDELVRGWTDAILPDTAAFLEAAPAGTPELVGWRLARTLIVAPQSEGCAGPPAAATAWETHALTFTAPVQGARAVVRDATGAIVAEADDHTPLADGLPTGTYTVCVESSDGRAGAVRLDVEPAPFTQIMLLELAPDASATFRSVTHAVHRGSEPLTVDRFMSSDFLRIDSVADGRGVPLALRSEHDKAQQVYQYEVVFPEPVAPGELVVKDTRGAWLEPMATRAQDGSFAYELRHSPNASVPTMRVEVFRLPEGAEVIEVGDGVRISAKDGRIELAHVGWVPPQGSIETTFKYRLRE